MLHLLLLEWKKLKSYRTFKVLIGLYVFSLPFIITLAAVIRYYANKFGNQVGGDVVPNPFIFPYVWETLGYAGNWLNFFCLGIIGIFIITNEVSYKTLRKSIITGLTRKEFFIAKVNMLIALALFATLYYMIVAFISGYFSTGYIHSIGKVFEGFEVVPRYFLQCMGYMSFAFFLGWLFRSMALSMIVFLVYTFFLEMAIRWSLIGWYKIQAVQFMPMNTIEDLVPIPLMMAENLVEDFSRENGFQFFLNPTQAVIVSIGYIALFLGLSYLRFKKSDL